MKKLLLLMAAITLCCANWAATVEVSTWAEARAALLLEEETTVRLTADMSLNFNYSSADIKGVKVLDLNGHKVTATPYALCGSTEDDYLTITGNGEWTVSGSYGFYTVGSGDKASGGRDNGHLTIENGTFKYGDYYNFLWIGGNGYSAPTITINGGYFDFYANNSSGKGQLLYSNYDGVVLTVSDGIFHTNNNGNMFRGGNVYINGGTYYNRYQYADYVAYRGYANMHLGDGKVVYVNGVKSDFAFADGTTQEEGRLIQIGNSDDEFVTATLSATEGGKGVFLTRQVESKCPTSMKLKKNVALDIPIKAVANDGYKFTGWSDVTGTTLPSTSEESTTLRVGTADITAKANFKLKSLHSIVFPVMSGATFTSNSSTYEDADPKAYEGKYIAFNFKISDGYLPVSLTVKNSHGDAVSALNITDEMSTYQCWVASFTMPDDNVTVNAVALPKRTVTVESAANGSVEANKTETWEGAEVTLTVTPDDGYRLKTLTAVTGSTPVAITDNKFTMPSGDVIVTPVFELIPSYTIAINSAAGGSVTTAPAGSAKAGSTVELTIAEDAGYVLSSLTVKQGDDVVALNEVDALHHTFVMPEGNVTITLAFEASVMFDITKIQAGTGSGSVEISQTSANVGREIIITAVAKDLNYVEGISVVRNDNSEAVEVVDGKFTMPAAAVTVTVTINPYADINAANWSEASAGLLLTTPAIVHLTADFMLNFQSSSKDFKGVKILDLNGHKVTATPYALCGSTEDDYLTITGNGEWTVSGSYGFYTVGSGDKASGGSDNGHLTIENGTFKYGDYYNFLWIGGNGYSAPTITINGGYFDFYARNSSGNGQLLYSNYDGVVLTVNDGIFHTNNNGNMFRGGNVYINGGTYYNRYQYADYVAYRGDANMHLGDGKVVYVNGVKSDFAFADGTTQEEGRLIQIGNSDDEFVTATLSATEGGKGIFLTRQVESYCPTSMKLKKNVDLDIAVKAIAENEYQFTGWSNVSGTTLESDDAETAFRVGASDIAVTANFVSSSTSVDEAQADKPKAEKILRDGHIFIISGDRVFNAQGAEIK